LKMRSFRRSIWTAASAVAGNEKTLGLGGSAKLGTFKLPHVSNEPMRQYGPGSTERKELQQVVEEMRKVTHEVPCVVNGKRIFSNKSLSSQEISSDHQKKLCKYQQADALLTEEAIHGALQARLHWERLSLNDRAAVFLKAAELLSTKYRYQVMAATMLGQGKIYWQAEIDSAAELIDFWRFNCHFAEQIYREQPLSSAGTWNQSEYRPLEGFVYAISPFNFTAIGGNLCSAPALMGNTVLWKPSSAAIYSNYLVYTVLEEAGLPPGVIQFLPGPAAEITEAALKHPSLAGVHFTGSTNV